MDVFTVVSTHFDRARRVFENELIFSLDLDIRALAVPTTHFQEGC